MTRTAFVLLAAFVLASTSLVAADISGTWKGTAEGPNGSIERTFTFKVDGTKLTGETTSEFLGKSEIKEGKIEGDAISFYITANFQGNEAKLTYSGKAGEPFKLTSTFAGNSDFPPIEWTLTKSK